MICWEKKEDYKMNSQISILCFQNLKPAQEQLLTSISPDIKIIVMDREDLKDDMVISEDINIVLAWGQQCIDPLLPQMPNLKWVQTLSAGVDQILTPAIIEREIPVSNAKGIHGVPISEYIFANLLSHYRRLPEMRENHLKKNWHRVIGDELFNKTIGIVGLGSIGRDIAKRSKAFGMEVYANKHHKTEELFIDELYTNDELVDTEGTC